MGRLIVLAVCLFAVCLAPARAQTVVVVSGPSLRVTPVVAGPSSARAVSGGGFPASSQVQVEVYGPQGGENLYLVQAGSDGTFQLPLAPPAGGWNPGLYRVVTDGGMHRALDAAFVVGNGKPALYGLPDLPSVTSAVTYVGTGLPPNQQLQFVFRLANLRGDRPLTVTTDANGTFTLSLWPEQVNEAFFEAGFYRGILPAFNLEANITVREHPAGAAIQVEGPVRNGLLSLHLYNYEPNRDIWAVWQSFDGSEHGELALGRTSAYGVLDVTAQLPPVKGGSYLVATPFDWGEAEFSVDAPPTSTPTNTPTSTATPTATATPSPAPAARHHCKPGHVWRNGHCHPKKPRKP